jgi:hypothetical protein
MGLNETAQPVRCKNWSSSRFDRIASKPVSMVAKPLDLVLVNSRLRLENFTSRLKLAALCRHGPRAVLTALMAAASAPSGVWVT